VLSHALLPTAHAHQLAGNGECQNSIEQLYTPLPPWKVYPASVAGVRNPLLRVMHMMAVGHWPLANLVMMLCLRSWCLLPPVCRLRKRVPHRYFCRCPPMEGHGRVLPDTASSSKSLSSNKPSDSRHWRACCAGCGGSSSLIALWVHKHLSTSPTMSAVPPPCEAGTAQSHTTGPAGSPSRRVTTVDAARAHLRGARALAIQPALVPPSSP
jgi:hypothetical protein